MPDTIISVYPIITHRPFIFISDFHVYNFTSSSSKDSVLTIESFAYTSSHGQTGRNSLDIASYTMIKRSEMRTNIRPKIKLSQNPDKHPLKNQTPRYSFPASHVHVNELDQVHQPLFYSKLAHCPTDDILWNLIKCFLQVNGGHVERLVSSQVLLL